MTDTLQVRGHRIFLFTERFLAVKAIDSIGMRSNKIEIDDYDILRDFMPKRLYYSQDSYVIIYEAIQPASNSSKIKNISDTHSRRYREFVREFEIILKDIAA